ncbi:ParB/RepB/Spo0J family partition protein, partial [Candidatus Marinimicrobia bacterium]|nr:ParB/RepB/Spo0J family partition protein [Candidatus Neomarinimicrobiota bacterium]
MSSKRLGKGINAIINTNSKKGEKTISAPGVSKIQLKDIKPNPDQPRRDFNEKSLDELCSSIKEKGIITPITVREHAGTYEIIAGERRWR